MRFKADSVAVHKLLRIKISNAKGTLKRNRKNHSRMDIFSVLQIFTAIIFMGYHYCPNVS